MRRHRYGDRVRVFSWVNGGYVRGARGTVMRATTSLDDGERMVVLLDVVHSDVGIVEVPATDVVRAERPDPHRGAPPDRSERHRRFQAMATPLRWDQEAGQWHVGGDAVRVESVLAAAALRAIGRNLRRERRRQRVTQAELANFVSMETGDISRLERGLDEAGVFTIVLLAKALDVQPQILLVGTGGATS